MPPRVSVLMCARNAERYVGEAVQSILRQTHENLEFIVVENASTDRTWEILRQERDPRLRLIQSRIPDLTFSLNLGLANASGDLVARMDADDIALPERLQAQVDFMEGDPAIGVLGTWFETFGDEIPSTTIQLPIEDHQIRRALPFRFVLCHPTIMFRRELVVEAGGYQGFRSCEDLELWLRIARSSDIKFGNLPKVLLRYRLHSGQARGSREGYAGSAAVLLKEGLATGRWAPITGAAWSWMKFLLRRVFRKHDVLSH